MMQGDGRIITKTGRGKKSLEQTRADGSRYHPQKFVVWSGNPSCEYNRLRGRGKAARNNFDRHLECRLPRQSQEISAICDADLRDGPDSGRIDEDAAGIEDIGTGHICPTVNLGP